MGYVGLWYWHQVLHILPFLPAPSSGLQSREQVAQESQSWDKVRNLDHWKYQEQKNTSLGNKSQKYQSALLLCKVKMEDKTFALTHQNKYFIYLYISIKGSCSQHGYDEKIQIIMVFWENPNEAQINTSNDRYFKNKANRG